MIGLKWFGSVRLVSYRIKVSKGRINQYNLTQRQRKAQGVLVN